MQITAGLNIRLYSYVLVSNILQNLTGSAANSFSYDAVGNLTQDNQLSYAYDGFGRLQQVTGSTTTAQYAYNAQHQRVQKTVNGTTTYFYYDDAGRLLAELDSQGQVVSEYIYLGYTPLARVDNQPSNPPIAANSSALELSHPLYYLHTDQIAAINAITDVNQQVVWQSEHDAFGKTTPTVQLLNQPLRFPGQYADAETGLYYNWHRYYNPLTGRYISSDPIGLDGGLNTFGYVGQSPLSYYDNDGLNRGGGSPYARGGFGNPYGVPSLGRAVNMRDIYRQRQEDLSIRELLKPQTPPEWLYRQPQPQQKENVCTPTFPDHIFSSKAPYQVEPPIRELGGRYINDLGTIQPWRAFYDAYGRLVGRTDYNAGNRAQGIPETHYHTYEWGRGKTPYESGSHLPGEYIP